ncbi:hypothetical protein [Thermomonas sp.]|uniref:hypothetical protein n=1 Tax=Thermomonas sp. TaxID=1971895 RepID=UPI0035AEB614
MTKLAAALFAASVAFATPAFAQDSGTATLRVESGSIMTSTGGDYVTATSGQNLEAGQKVMVNENSVGILTYGNGCKIKLDVPGVYAVPNDCKAIAAKAGAGSNMSAGIIALSALVAAGLINNEENTPAGPLSNGIRHF